MAEVEAPVKARRKLRQPAAHKIEPGVGDDLLCAACHHLITTTGQRLEVAGGYEHTFANPHGIVYHIGCFRTAPGCTWIGTPTTDFTWFPGFAWRMACCAACQAHLGWRYDGAEGDTFHGLITARLVANPRERR